jgi:hypothetical protein
MTYAWKVLLSEDFFGLPVGVCYSKGRCPCSFDLFPSGLSTIHVSSSRSKCGRHRPVTSFWVCTAVPLLGWSLRLLNIIQKESLYVLLLIWYSWVIILVNKQEIFITCVPMSTWSEMCIHRTVFSVNRNCREHLQNLVIDGRMESYINWTVEKWLVKQRNFTDVSK